MRLCLTSSPGWVGPFVLIWFQKLKPTVKNDLKWQFSCYFVLIEDVHHQKLGREKCQKFKFLKKKKAWKCGGPWRVFFLQRFFKHFQYVPILAQMSTSAEAAVEFLPKNVENGFFFGKVFEVKSVCSSPAAKNPVGWFEPEGPEEVLLAHISQKGYWITEKLYKLKIFCLLLYIPNGLSKG